ncbi:MAG: acetolactate synthase small subunit [Crocinitomicaceae bacterium TMED16]|nr:acetolactate synthase small subunit [Crocinitomicaceae bacterium]OUT72230.1 MAG: acetolactate synthase small subunit [Crocinitomicaceae bacterium TMED16]|tara:strand:+ start:1691 stop:2218 length:528 start_codon:yes stop_codon:yes gene_type:complete
MKKRYTISVFTEDIVGLLNRVTIVFTRRKINIESIAASDSEVQNIHRYTIVINETEDLVKKVTLQLDKQVEVIKAVYHLDEEIIYQEIALFKVPTDILMQGGEAEYIVRAHHARVLSVEPEFTVIEKTGHKEETQHLFDELEPFGILEFVRSGRVAITKPMRTLTSIVNELENTY